MYIHTAGEFPWRFRMDRGLPVTTFTGRSGSHATMERMGIRRIVVAAAGPDDAGREADVLVHALREAGDEVIHAGHGQSAEQIVFTAIAEDAAAIGLPGATAGFRASVRTLLVEQDVADIELL